MDHKLYMTFVHKVNALIDKANELWDERNAKAVAEGEEELVAHATSTYSIPPDHP